MRRPCVAVAASLSLLAGCVAAPTPEPLEPQIELTPVSFADMPGWRRDDPGPALFAFRRSCAIWQKRPGDRPTHPDSAYSTTAADWHAACAALPPPGGTAARARAYFERHFQPFAVTDRGKPTGLFTGYFEPLLYGSRSRHGAYQTPLYRRPESLVSVDLGRFRDSLRGERIAGRVEDGRLVPFADRSAIERGALAGRGLELLYVDDPVDAFFLHVQGSGQVELESGERIRLGYAGQNGHSYYAIGRALIDMGALSRETVSLQSIRAWLTANPRKAVALMRENPSFVFFRELDGPGPLGAEGTPLTPGRSMAVDRRFLPLGTPLWLDIEDPREAGQRLRRLVVAQDVGGAIRGVVRGDLFWGAGKQAAAAAGAMRSQGRKWILLPRASRRAKSRQAAGLDPARRAVEHGEAPQDKRGG